MEKNEFHLNQEILWGKKKEEKKKKREAMYGSLSDPESFLEAQGLQ